MSSLEEKYTKCDILLENGFSHNPQCDHGPTVLFSRGGQKFYACSAYRSRHLCNFYSKWSSDSHQVNTSRKKPRKERKSIHTNGSNNSDINPEDNQGQAQYYFSEVSMMVLLEFLGCSGIQRILCLGTPTIHENFKGTSYLLDIDPKFQSSIDQFSRYNMCNHHFFDSASHYLNYLKDSPNLVVICDPPFGARFELLFNTFKLIRNDWNVHAHKGKLEFIFINPYFAEGKIIKLDETFKMSDYRVEYASHKKFKHGDKSPVRIFTTLDLSRLELPSPDYKFCSVCQKYVFSNSKHCLHCRCCDSRDGKNYYHCDKCNRCFKETWSHCNTCSACHLSDGQKCRISNFSSKKSRKRKIQS